MKLFIDKQKQIITQDLREENEYFYVGDNQVNVVECLFDNVDDIYPTINLLQANGRQIVGIYSDENGTNEDGKHYYRWHLSSAKNQLVSGRLDIQVMLNYISSSNKIKCVGVVSINVRKGAWLTENIFITGDDEAVTNMLAKIEQLALSVADLQNKKLDASHGEGEYICINNGDFTNAQFLELTEIADEFHIEDATKTILGGTPTKNANLTNKLYVDTNDKKYAVSKVTYSVIDGYVRFYNEANEEICPAVKIDIAQRAIKDELGNVIHTTYETKENATAQRKAITDLVNQNEDNNTTAHSQFTTAINKLNEGKATTNNLALNFIPSTGVLQLKYGSNVIGQVDLPTELIVSSGYYDSKTNEIVLVLANGNEIRFSALGLIDVYTGSVGDMIKVDVTSDNIIKASILEGSISEDKFDDALHTLLENWKVVVESELARQNNETERQAQELERVNAENQRILNEEQRQSNEEERNANEQIRISNENSRKEEFHSQMETITDLQGSVEKNTIATENMRLQLANLYEALNGYILTVGEETYTELDSAILNSTIEVGDTIFNIADARTALSSVKGRTKKASNQIQLEGKETTVNGVTYTIQNGAVICNGTSNAVSFINFNLGLTLNGNYVLSSFNNAADSNVSCRLFYDNDPSKTIAVSNVEFINQNSYKSFNVNYNNVGLTIRVSSGTTLNNLTIKPMLVEGSEAPTTFEPYYEGLKSATFAGVELTGVNLFLPKDEDEPTVSNGLTSQIIDQHFIIKGTSINAYNVVRTIDIELPVGTYGVRKSSSFGMQVTYEDGTIEYPNIYPTGVMTITKKTKAISIYQTIKGNTTYNLDHTLIISKGDIIPVKWLKALKPTVLPFDKQTLNGVGTAQDTLSFPESELGYDEVVERKVDKYTFTGNENLVQTSTANGSYRYWLTGLDMYATNNTSFVPNLISTLNLKVVSTANTWNNIEGITINGTVASGSNVVFEIYVSSIQTVSDMLQYLKGNTIYFELPTSTQTTLATNLTYEQMTAMREAGGTIKVVGNDNVDYNVKPDITMSVIYKNFEATPKTTAISESESDL